MSVQCSATDYRSLLEQIYATKNLIGFQYPGSNGLSSWSAEPQLCFFLQFIDVVVDAYLQMLFVHMIRRWKTLQRAFQTRPTFDIGSMALTLTIRQLVTTVWSGTSLAMVLRQSWRCAKPRANGAYQARQSSRARVCAFCLTYTTVGLCILSLIYGLINKLINKCVRLL